MTNTVLISALLAGSVLFASCKTYYIPVDSFRQQFAGMGDSDMSEVTTRGPLGHQVKYKTYPIDSIHAVDKKGSPVTIPNGPSIEIRFTNNANKKTAFYFDLIRFDGVNINGARSRPFGFRKTIRLSDVKKIEVQDGKKNFHYIAPPNRQNEVIHRQWPAASRLVLSPDSVGV